MRPLNFAAPPADARGGTTPAAAHKRHERKSVRTTTNGRRVRRGLLFTRSLPSARNYSLLPRRCKGSSAHEIFFRATPCKADATGECRGLTVGRLLYFLANPDQHAVKFRAPEAVQR